jgi:pimeloyl-ACP methyl ester carboxylesterase
VLGGREPGASTRQRASSCSPLWARGQYDRRSFGASTHPPLADPERHGKDAAALLRALDPLPAVVLGWSAGPRCAWRAPSSAPS